MYILECSDGTYYCGATKDWQKRLEVHKAGKASRYTRARLPVKILYVEYLTTFTEALKREFEIKKMTRQKKEELVK